MTLVDIDQHIRTLDLASLTAVDAPADSAETKANRRHLRRVTKRRYARLEERAAAIEHLAPLPGPDEALHLALDGRYAAWHIFTAIAEILATPIERLTCATLGFNSDNCRDLLDLLDSGRVRNVLLVVSDYFRHSDRNIFRNITRDLESRGQRVAIARSHAKLLLIESGEHNIVCETSANLRSSQNWEQAVIADDKELLAFHREWLTYLLDKETT